MNTQQSPYSHPPTPFPYILLPTTNINPQKGPVLPSCPPLKKRHLICFVKEYFQILKYPRKYLSGNFPLGIILSCIKFSKERSISIFGIKIRSDRLEWTQLWYIKAIYKVLNPSLVEETELKWSLYITCALTDIIWHVLFS
jgi:hypothetical protein